MQDIGTKEVTVTQQTSQREFLNQIVTQEKEKVNVLSVLSQDERNEIIAGLQYAPVPYFPITKTFTKNTILNDIEYPLIESKMSQAAIELKSRFNRIVDDHYEMEKLKLEIDELQLDLEDIENSELSDQRKFIAKRKKELDRTMRIYRLTSMVQNIKNTFQEYQTWKQVLDECLEEIKKHDPNIKVLEDINFNKLREAEIDIKIRRWAEMAAHGEELTIPQKVLILDKGLKEQEKKKQLLLEKQGEPQ